MLLAAPIQKSEASFGARCDIDHHLFTVQGELPTCDNCGRIYCKDHAGAPLEEGILPGKRLCKICRAAYEKDGLAGLNAARLGPLRTHGS